jgi:hypothetical protein
VTDTPVQDIRHPLATKQGWQTFAAEGLPTPPRLLAAADFAKLTGLELEFEKELRQGYHSELLLVSTPDIQRIVHTGSKLIINNRRKQLGRRGLMVSGPSGTGKSTSIAQLGKKYQYNLDRRLGADPDRIPVVYIVVPPDATPKMLAGEMAVFLGLPIGDRDSPQAVAHTVASVMRQVGTGLVLVDEIHRIDMTSKQGRNVSDQLKYFFDTVNATFVYAGLDLEETGMFSGVRGRQIARRFVPITTAPFPYRTEQDKNRWASLVASMEQTLRLHRHKPGALQRLAPYLHARTAGMIGSLDQLVYEAANDAISDGLEKITKKHLDAVILDIAAEDQYTKRPSTRQPRTRREDQR